MKKTIFVLILLILAGGYKINAMKKARNIPEFYEVNGYVKILDNGRWTCLLCDPSGRGEKYKKKYHMNDHMARSHSLVAEKIDGNYEFTKLNEVPAWVPLGYYVKNGHVKKMCAGVVRCSYCGKIILRVSQKDHLLLWHRIDLNKPFDSQDFSKLRNINECVRSEAKNRKRKRERIRIANICNLFDEEPRTKRRKINPFFLSFLNIKDMH